MIYRFAVQRSMRNIKAEERLKTRLTAKILSAGYSKNVRVLERLRDSEYGRCKGNLKNDEECETGKLYISKNKLRRRQLFVDWSSFLKNLMPAVTPSTF